MRTAKKMKIALFFTVALMIFYMGAAYFQLSRIGKHIQQLYQTSEQAENTFFNLTLDYYDRLLEIKDLIIEKRKFTDSEILMLSSSFRSEVDYHIEYVSNTRDKYYALTLSKLYDLLLIRVKNYGENDFQEHQALLGIIDAESEGITLIKTQFQYFLTLRSSSIRATTQHTIADSLTWLLLISMWGLATVILIVFYIFREIIKPIEKLSKNLETFGPDEATFATEDGTSVEVSVLAEKLGHKFYEITHYDKTTGLPNLALFLIYIDQYIKEHKEKALSLLLIGIDKFSKVNELHGMTVSEELLKVIAKRIKHNVPEGTFIAKGEGDLFMVLLVQDEFHEQFIDFTTSVTKQLLKEIEKVMYIKKLEFHLTACIGICVYPQDGKNTDVLLKNSHHALNQAKKVSINSFQFYSKELNAQAAADAKLEIELRRAIKEQTLTVYYQPQADLHTGKIVGAEALIRWHHETLGFIPTSHFVSIAEHAELLVPLTDWVIAAVCEQFSAWKEEGLMLDKISINLTAQQFRNEKLLEDIPVILQKHDLEPSHIEFEITESIMMSNMKQTAAILNQLKKIGVQIAVDDFGTGYSSLSYLKDFPVDLLKIDKAFIEDIERSKDARSILESIIVLGHKLNLKVIAEGISNTQQLNILKEAACDEIQGFLISQPLPPEEFTTLLKQWDPKKLI